MNRHVCGMVGLQRFTGARSGEICVMRPCDIDRSGVVWIYRPTSHKNENRGLDRLIYIGPRAKEILAPFLENIGPEEFVFSPRRMTKERYRLLRQKRKSKVQPSQISRAKRKPRRKPGKRYDTKAYYHAVLNGCRKAGVERWHPHQTAAFCRDPAAGRIWHRVGPDHTWPSTPLCHRDLR